jgi:hypothetical protein
MVARDTVVEPNLAYLDAQLRRLRLRLTEPSTDAIRAELSDLDRIIRVLENDADAQGWTLRLRRLARLFSLDTFEQNVLVLAAAPDLDERLGAMIAHSQPSAVPWPTAGLAWRLFCDKTAECVASRDAFRADAQLLRFGLIEALDEALPLPARPLRIDRRIADELAGRTAPDARIVPFLRSGASDAPFARRALAVRLAETIVRFLREGERPPHLVVSLSGASVDDLEALARGAAALANLPLLAARSDVFPLELAPFFVRESILLPAALFVGGIDPKEGDGPAWLRFLADGGPIVFLCGDAPLAPARELEDARWLTVVLPALELCDRTSAWQERLAAIGLNDADAANFLGARYDLDESEMHAATRSASAAGWYRESVPTVSDVVESCRFAARHRMAELAQMLVPAFGWDDLLLPSDSLEKLRELEAHVEHASRVFDDLGFAARVPRGRGVSALFAGPSGTGKTMAAEVIAGALGRELYRVDLARVVSKYIGETEKNLRAIFGEAENARCVVLFDEADALFGKRTEVRDSHDRYANIEVSYLLQLLEDTQNAVVLLATNRRDAIDDAFLRRFRFVVDFPMPSHQTRLALWGRSFPHQVDTSRVRFDVLAERLPVSGASIKNIALAATFLAAPAGAVITAAHIERATRRELEKLMRPTPLREEDLSAGPAP